MNPIPDTFSGLLYAPNGENGVYLLMGLLWPYLPYRFAFEAFEIDPRREGYPHGKHLDAKARLYQEGGWRDVTVEFKLHSSGLRRDLEKYPGLHADFLICWIHDAPDIERHVGKVLELSGVLNALPPEERQRFVRWPEKTARPQYPVAPIDRLLERFSEPNRAKVALLLQQWPHAAGGSAEIRFLEGTTVVFRACAYASEHLIVRNVSGTETGRLLEREFHGRPLEEGVRLSLYSLTTEGLLRLVQILWASR